MFGPPSTSELRIRVLDRLRHMFSNAKDGSLLAPTVYKRYFDKNVRVMKSVEEGDIAFLDRQKQKLKTEKERDEQIDKSKLLPKSTGPSVLSGLTCMSCSSTEPVPNCLFLSTDAVKLQPKTQHRQTRSLIRYDKPSFPLPHPIVNENSQLFSEGPAHHLSKTAAAQSPYIFPVTN